MAEGTGRIQQNVRASRWQVVVATRGRRSDIGGEACQKEENVWLAGCELLAEQPPVQAAPLGQALNLNKRGQVLRMQRRGENPETIAGALGIPRNEVDLLLKVHQMTLERVGPVESGARA